MRVRFAFLLLFITIPVFIFAEDKADSVDESSIFSDESTVTESKSVIKEETGKSVEKESLSFTGFLNSRTSYTMSRDWLKGNDGGFDQNSFLSFFQSNYSLDARMRKNMKGFANVSLDYFPAGTNVIHNQTALDPETGLPLGKRTNVEKENAVFIVEELFVDINFNRMAYLRLGKQVLRWGTGYLWVPSDLINVEKKNILDPSQVREGTYGAKLSIPFGTFINFYTFAGMNNANNVDQLSGAFKLEMLLGITEASVSTLLRKGSVPIYAFDFTSRLFTVDLHSEAAASYGDSDERFDFNNPRASTVPASTDIGHKRKGKWIPSASFGLGRAFEFLDIKDRIRIDTEFFYNGRGYRKNIFEMNDIAVSNFTRNGFFTPNYYGIYYAGLFLTYNRLFIQDLILTLIYIQNITDRSSVISELFAYSFEYNVFLYLQINEFTGKANREYTIGSSSSSTALITKVLSAEFMVKLIF